MTKIIGLTGGIGSGKLRLRIIFNPWIPCYTDDEEENYAIAEVINAIKILEIF
jgi:dephospho-CoA kinase